MSDSTTQQLWDLWRKQFEEGAQAWARMLGTAPAAPPPPDPMAFWRPVVDQWVQAWARLLAQTPMTPDVLTQYKQFLDQSIDAWSRALGHAMNTEGFAQLLGRYLDQWLAVYGPARKAGDQAVESALQTLNIASRSQATTLARQVVEVDERVERVEEMLGTVLRRLDEIGRALGRLETAAPGERR